MCRRRARWSAPDRLRFDFSHPEGDDAEDELKRVEDEVNEVMRQNVDVSTRLMPTAKAIEAGAVAMFGEKYGDEVRVLSMGSDLEADGRSPIRSSCAAARMCAASATSACSRSSPKARSRPACAASRR